MFLWSSLFVLTVSVALKLSSGAGHEAHIRKVMERRVLYPGPPEPSRAPYTDVKTQAGAVLGVVRRLLPSCWHLFHITVDPFIAVDGRDTVMVVSPLENGTAGVAVTGSGGVAAAWGILHYIKQYCHCHISWEADQLHLPQALPEVNITITAKDRVRYYQNVCTVSYSSVWWQWPRWEREIDWMALNGINLPLAFTGQEAVWRRVYLGLGLTDEELQSFFSGPAFLAWHRMGNLMAWGGPLPVSWHNATELLQKKILIRMRELGITPVLPCFAGHVPGAIKRVFPDANITRQSAWGHLNDSYTRTYMLEPYDPLFRTLGVLFINEMRETYNYTDGFFNCDPFNEQIPSSNSSEYISSVGEAIFGAMQQADPTAIWVLQGWMLRNQFWTEPTALALLKSAPLGRILVLDLAAEVDPMWKRHSSFYGQPFVFCMLHNYGGVDGLFGNVQVLTQHLTAARSSNNTMVGSGLSMEGINQNYVMYDLMMEMAWEDPPMDILKWAGAYSRRRYGSRGLEGPWALLMIWYPVGDLVSAWDGLVAATYRLMWTRRTQRHLASEDDDVEEGWPWEEKAHRALTGEAAFKDTKKARPWEEKAHRALTGEAAFKDTKQALAVAKTTVVNRLEEDYSTQDEGVEANDVIAREELELLRIQIINKTQRDMERHHVHCNTSIKKPRGREWGEMIHSQPHDDLSHGIMVPVNEQKTFRHDLVDVSREVLQVLVTRFVQKLVTAYKLGSAAGIQSTGAALLRLLRELDALLGTSPDFLLGHWTKGAETWASSQQERKLYVYNAMNQITIWGPPGQGHLDYAIKQWSGVVSGYIAPRWSLFVSALLDCVLNNKTLDQAALDKRMSKEVEEPFTLITDPRFPSEPIGDAVRVVQKLYRKYRSFFPSSTLSTAD